MKKDRVGLGYVAKEVEVYKSDTLHVTAIEFHRKVATRPRNVVKQDITKEKFLANLGKVCQPISKEPPKPDSEKSET
jgi:hypothetical protein